MKTNKILQPNGNEIKEGSLIIRDGSVVQGVDTSKFNEGQKIYLDPDNPGAFISEDEVIKRFGEDYLNKEM